jgi:alpha-galactosidase
MQSVGWLSLLASLFLSAVWPGCLVPTVTSLRNGLALTPPMGWSTWNTFRCQYTEKDLREVAEVLVSSGLQAAGYSFLNIDDCWEERNRTADGLLAANSTKFPNGLQAFGSYLHSRNLSFGLYTSSGPYTCQEYPGSWQHEEADAKTFAGWGVDFLKVSCTVICVHRVGPLRLP